MNMSWMVLKFIYSEKATKFCKISTVDLTGTTYIGHNYDRDFQNIWTSKDFNWVQYNAEGVQPFLYDLNDMIT